MDFRTEEGEKMNGSKHRKRAAADGRCRYTTRLSKDLIKRLRRESERRRVPQQRIIETLLLDRYNPEHQEEFEASFVKRLNSIDNHLENLERKIEAVGEAVAIYVKMWLTATPDLLEKEKAAAIARAQRRYERFVAGVEQGVRTGKTLLSEMSRHEIANNTETGEMRQ
jgi:hypothetical protein